MASKIIKVEKGKKYGLLKIIEEVVPKKMKRKDGGVENIRRVFCKCDCGKGFIADLGRLTRGKINLAPLLFPPYGKAIHKLIYKTFIR